MVTEPPLEEFELKKRKKTIQTVLNCDVSNYYSASVKEHQANFEVESTMIN